MVPTSSEFENLTTVNKALNWGDWMAQWIKKPSAMQETQEMRVWYLGQEDPLKK